MNKHSGLKHKRAAKKDRKRTERKGKKGTRGYRKGSKSKTMKGKKDFTTKKTSKVFNRRKHYQKHAKGSRVIRRPYAKKGGMTQASSTGTVWPSLTGSGWVTNHDGKLWIDGHRPHTGPPPPQASASTKTTTRVKTSKPLIVPTKSGAYVFDGKAGAVSGN